MFRRQKRAFTGVTWDEHTGAPRISAPSSRTRTVTQDKAMTQSAWWACIRLRADLISTFPVDVFRDLKVGGQIIPVEMPTPPILVDPGGKEWDFIDWMWASQRDLDTAGNAIGVITARNGAANKYYPEGLPAVIELADIRDCAVLKVKGKWKYRIGGKQYEPNEVFHERQYPMSGTPIGLSPLLHAADTLGELLALQQYGLDWFGNGGVPKAWLKNTVKRLGDEERTSAKTWYRDTIGNGDLMVTGNDWEYNMIQAETAGMEWINGRQFGSSEIARFLGVPSDLIDAAISGQSITYANMTERNLQFLIMNLNAAVIRRERTLTRLLPQPRYVKLATKSLLRMSPMLQQQIIRSQLETWQLTHDEARGLDNRAPFTAAQLAEMRDIYGKATIGGTAAAPALPADQEDTGGPPADDSEPGAADDKPAPATA